jgi:hypothetical protein
MRMKNRISKFIFDGVVALDWVVEHVQRQIRHKLLVRLKNLDIVGKKKSYQKFS